MKKFDLEAAKAGAPVCTRDGKPVRIVCFDRKTESELKLLALIEYDEDGELCGQYTLKGEFWSELACTWDSRLNLMMAPTQHTTYVILFRRKNGEIGIDPLTFDTIEEAEKEARMIDDVITIGEITWEE